MDTDTIVAAMRSPAGASAALLRAARTGGVTLPATGVVPASDMSGWLSFDIDSV